MAGQARDNDLPGPGTSQPGAGNRKVMPFGSGDRKHEGAVSSFGLAVDRAAHRWICRARRCSAFASASLRDCALPPALSRTPSNLLQKTKQNHTPAAAGTQGDLRSGALGYMFLSSRCTPATTSSPGHAEAKKKNGVRAADPGLAWLAAVGKPLSSYSHHEEREVMGPFELHTKTHHERNALLCVERGQTWRKTPHLSAAQKQVE